MKKTIVSISILFISLAGFSQKKTTTSAILNFDASTSIDALPVAENKAVIAAIDLNKGSVSFEAAIKNFSFSNPIMQKHFNEENWMNSDKFPKATFNGKLNNSKNADFSKSGKYEVEVTGDLTIKDITNQVKTIATITVDDKSTTANAEFTISLSDYGIKGAAIEAGKLAKDPKITVSAKF
jgi:polyisoprenoid-binding protein YceI